MKNLMLALVVLVAVFGLVGCEAMPVTMTPFASYGGTGIDYPSPGRTDPNHQWQVGASASFVLGARGVVANAVPTPSLPSTVRVDQSNMNSNANSTTNNTTNSGNVNNGTINNGTINGGIK